MLLLTAAAAASATGTPVDESVPAVLLPLDLRARATCSRTVVLVRHRLGRRLVRRRRCSGCLVVPYAWHAVAVAHRDPGDVDAGAAAAGARPSPAPLHAAWNCAGCWVAARRPAAARPSRSRCCCRCATRRTGSRPCLRRPARPARRAATCGAGARRRLDRRHRRRRTPGGRRRRAGAAARRQRRCRPAGSGKPYACHQLAERGRPAATCWSSSTPTWCSPRTRSPRRSALLRGRARPGLARTRGSVAVGARPSGWCSRCCSGPG